MVKVTFVRPDGTDVAIDGKPGTSLMQTAVNAGIEGIVAECGGSATCATCHVYVDPRDLDRLPEMGPIEDDMLMEAASPRNENSRLSCQIVLSDALDGLRVTVPETQY